MIFSYTLKPKKNMKSMSVSYYRSWSATSCSYRRKMLFFQTETRFLGYTVSSEGLKPDSTLINKVMEFPIPANKTQLRSFLGTASFYRRFMPNFAQVAEPLHSLTKTDALFCWEERHQQSFAKLKQLLTTAPVLKLADPDKSMLSIQTPQILL